MTYSFKQYGLIIISSKPDTEAHTYLMLGILFSLTYNEHHYAQVILTWFDTSSCRIRLA